MNPLDAVAKHAKLGEGFSNAEIADSNVHGGRNTKIKGYQSPVAWISDLIALKKVIILCSFCRVKFNHRQHHYRKMYRADLSGSTDGFQANGQCDCCKQFTPNCGGGTAFVHEEDYSLVCQDPSAARRDARAAAKQLSVWSALQRG